MPVKIQPITKRQLVDYFKVYREALPDWDVEHDVVLTRSLGPIKQVIAFEALRAGTYRPSCSVDVAVPPACVQILFRFLDIRHREVLPRDHESKWPTIIKAMEQQFVPSIRHPLDVAEVLRLAEEEAERDGINNINYSCALATLNAFDGQKQRALSWCDKMQAQAADRGRELADWESRLMEFATLLRSALEAGRERAFLTHALVR